MSPGTKRTIIKSKATGRRYFLVRTATRPGGRRYYICSIPTCKARVTREADLYCKAHSEGQQQSKTDDIADVSSKSDQVVEDDIQDNGEVIEEETSTKTRRSTKTELNHTEQQKENEKTNDVTEVDDDIPTNNSTALSPKSQSHDQTEIDEETSARSFRDRTGRHRYVCMHPSCKNVLKSQTEQFCRVHIKNTNNVNKNKKKRENRTRHSTPLISDQSQKKRYRSPFQTADTTVTSENGTNGNQSDEYEIPKKTLSPQRTGTTRSMRDASGKLRFLCSIPTCTSRVPRQSELYCKRHTLEMKIKEPEKDIVQPITTNGSVNEEEVNNSEEMDIQQNDLNISSRPSTSETPITFENKKRKRTSSITLSSIPPEKIVISATALLDGQWNDILSFFRQFPQIRLSTNLNVNNSTTHLIVDDSENHLHCTITKKIVQAAVRQHIFIISSRWINECMRLNTFIDEHPYEIISDSHTTLRLSKHNLNIINKYLFNQNSQCLYAFAIECRQCQGSINRSELIELIQLTGAQLFQNEQAVDILIVLCDTNDKNIYKIKEKYTHAPASNIKYVTSDFLLKSIIKFEIQDIDKYSL